MFDFGKMEVFKKKKFHVKQSHVVLVITWNEQLILMLLEKDNGFLKVHRQAFLLVPKNCQKVMVIMVVFRARRSKNSSWNGNDHGNNDGNDDNGDGDGNNDDIEDKST